MNNPWGKLFLGGLAGIAPWRNLAPEQRQGIASPTVKPDLFMPCFYTPQYTLVAKMASPDTKQGTAHRPS